MRERDRQKERAASSGQYWFLCRNLFTCNEQRDTFTQGRIANEEIDLRAWWYECEKSSGKYTLPKTFSSPLMKIGLTIYICWLREKMYSQSHSDTWEDEFWKMNSQSPPECVIAFPPLSCWEVSVKAENQHTHISALLTFNRLHLMHCAESEIRFNCGFDVLLRINQSPECGGYDYLTFIFSIRFFTLTCCSLWLESFHRCASEGFSRRVKTKWERCMCSLSKVKAHLSSTHTWFEET